MNKFKRKSNGIVDPEQDRFGVLTLELDDVFSIAADTFVRVLEETGVHMYMSAEPFGNRRYLRVKGIDDNRLRELYENFTKAVDAVNKEVGYGSKEEN